MTTLPAVVRIVDLPVATTITGVELLEVVQTSAGVGLSVQVSLSQIMTSIGGLPVGGATGQILNKTSGSNYSATWSSINSFVLVNGTTLATSGSATAILVNVASGGIGSNQLGTFAVQAANVATNAIGNVQLRQGSPLSIIGVAGSATANVADITASAANQVLQVNAGATGILFTTLAVNSAFLGITNTGLFNQSGTTLATGTFGVVGTAQFTGLFNVVGTTLFTSGAFGVVGTTLITGTFTQVGTSTMTGTNNLNGPLNVIGTATFTGIHNVNGTTLFTGAFGIAGTTIVTGVLNVIGTAAFTGGPFSILGTTTITGVFGQIGTSLMTGLFGVVGTAQFTSNFFGVVGTAAFTGVVVLASQGTGILLSSSTGVVNATNTLTSGVRLVAFNAGTTTGNTNITFDSLNGSIQFLTNNGTGTLTAPSNDGELDCMVINTTNASTLTFSGFNVGVNTGDNYTTTTAQRFVLSVRRINGSSTYRWAALQ